MTNWKKIETGSRFFKIAVVIIEAGESVIGIFPSSPKDRLIEKTDENLGIKPKRCFQCDLKLLCLVEFSLYL